MKLSHLYTNRDDLFVPIRFRDGLNAIIARVRHPKDRKKASHNLGKSLLIEILDFGLLKGLGERSVLKRRSDVFDSFVFYLEIRLQDGGYVTTRRSVQEPSKVSFKRHQTPYQNFSDLPEANWDHWRVPFDSAVTLLDGILSLSAIKPWSFRKGVAYFLRGQADYQDVFRLSKFQRNKDRDWKPYVGRVLGYDDELLARKYAVEDRVDELKRSLSVLRADVPLRGSDFEKLKAAIAVKRDEVSTALAALDRFDFSPQELSMAREVTDTIEAQIAQVNESLYNARHDLALVERGLRDSIEFNLEEVRQTFAEAQLAFPNQLARDYEALVEFNRRILSERNDHLRKRSEELQAEVVRLEGENVRLAARRRGGLATLSNTDSLRKFKELQRSLDDDRAALTVMESRVQRLQTIVDREAEIRTAVKEAADLAEDVQRMSAAGSLRFTAIQVATSRIVKEIVGRTALVFAPPNKEGNLDFKAEFTDTDNEVLTEEGRGTSFLQVLCIAFDLAVLTTYAHEKFFHFVYHDGALERLEKKRKVALLEVIRRACDEFGIQYIFSALAEDLPTGAQADKVNPSPDEIVLELHDAGTEGRLFRMATF